MTTYRSQRPMFAPRSNPTLAKAHVYVVDAIETSGLPSVPGGPVR